MSLMEECQTSAILRSACICGAAALWTKDGGPYKHIAEIKKLLEALGFDANTSVKMLLERYTSVKMLLERYLTIAIEEKLNQDPRLCEKVSKNILKMMAT